MPVNAFSKIKMTGEEIQLSKTLRHLTFLLS